MLVGAALAVWGLLTAIRAHGEPIPVAFVLPIALVAAVMVTNMKRANVINHHDPARLALPPHPLTHLAPWALLAAVLVTWAFTRLSASLPLPGHHGLTTAAVSVLVFAGVLASEWWLVRARADYQPAWTD